MFGSYTEEGLLRLVRAGDARERPNKLKPKGPLRAVIPRENDATPRDDDAIPREKGVTARGGDAAARAKHAASYGRDATLHGGDTTGTGGDAIVRGGGAMGTHAGVASPRKGTIPFAKTLAIRGRFWYAARKRRLAMHRNTPAAPVFSAALLVLASAAPAAFQMATDAAARPATAREVEALCDHDLRCAEDFGWVFRRELEAVHGAAGGSGGAAGNGPGDGPLEVLSSFNPSMSGGLCGGSYAPGTDMVWVYDCFAGTLEGYQADGTFVRALPVPGGTANDVDIDVATIGFELAGVPVPAGSLLFLNGERGDLDIYAVDPLTGDVIASLTAAFGSSHVVGGAFHPARGTFFVIKDRVPSDGNVVAEIDGQTGAVLNSFSTIAAGYDVHYGDLEVDLDTGNLLIVSSSRGTIAEFAPTGALLAEHPLPAGVGSLSGVGANADGVLWVFGTSGWAWELGEAAPPCRADLDGDGVLTLFDFLEFQNLFDAGDPAADFDGDGSLTLFDFLAFQNAFDAGCP